MAIRFAFVGFRHGHIRDLYRRAGETEGLEVVAACEEDAEAREEVAEKGVVITHTEYEAMLAEVSCDVVAIGDYFAIRGSRAIRGLTEGKHVLADKPLCTDLGEVDEIERLSGEKGLKVGCMLNMRDSGRMIEVRRLLLEGTVAEIHAISFEGQHPLSLGSRPAWYFEPGKHGGTITDLAIHAIDILPWLTGLEFSTVTAARCWNALAPEYPHFKDGAQMMLTMSNGCGVLGDVSYFTPTGAGYRMPFGWRMTFWGRDGVLETASAMDGITVAMSGGEELETRPIPEGNPGGYLKDFLDDIGGKPRQDGMSTETVLKSIRTAVRIQQAADERACGVDL